MLFDTSYKTTVSLTLIAGLVYLLGSTTGCKNAFQLERRNLFFTLPVSQDSIGSFGANVQGELIDVAKLGKDRIIAYGHCWSFDKDSPTLQDSVSLLGENPPVGIFSSTLSNLVPNTRYNVRAYIQTSAEIIYSNQVTFTTRPAIRFIGRGVSSIGLDSARVASLVGINQVNLLDIIDSGFCWSTNPNPDINTNQGRISTGVITVSPQLIEALLTGLTPGTRYFVRPYLIYAGGRRTEYGSETSFVTSQ